MVKVFCRIRPIPISAPEIIKASDHHHIEPEYIDKDANIRH